LHGVQGVASSNPATPTIYKVEMGQQMICWPIFVVSFFHFPFFFD